MRTPELPPDHHRRHRETPDSRLQTPDSTSASGPPVPQSDPPSEADIVAYARWQAARAPKRDYTEDLSADYPPHLKHLAPTHEELDMVDEEMTAKLTDRGSLQANVEGMRRRVALLRDQINGIATHQSEGRGLPDGAPDPQLEGLRQDYRRALEVLAGYEAQLKAQN